MKKGITKLVYDASDLVEVKPTPDINLPDIVATKCMQPKDGSPYLVFYCKPKDRYTDGCLVCGSINLVKHGTVVNPRIIHDVTVGNNRVDLILSVPRYKCNDCNAVFRTPFDSIVSNRQITVRLYEQLRRDTFSRPFTQIADTTGYTESQIRNIFDEYAAELENARGEIIAPRILGIDEKHIAHAARGVFVDIENGRLLEMTENNKKATVLSTIENMKDYDKNIKIVTTDMAGGYRSCVYECLPNAKLVVDKYHIYQDLYRKVTSSKTAIMAATAKQIDDETDLTKQAHLRSVRNLIAHNGYLFKFGKKKLAEKSSRMAIMADACNTFPEFNHLRLLKQGFERIYEDDNSRFDAEVFYEDWQLLVPPSGVKKVADWEKKYGVKAELFEAFKSFRATTKNWHEEIFNYFDPGCQVTNAATEGVNSMIQRINDEGTGYGFKRLRAKSLYRSNAGQRVTYQIKNVKTPVCHTSSVASNTGSASSPHIYFNKCFFSERKYMEYQDGTKIVQEASVPNNTWSVFSYVDENAEYYDFELNDE